MSDTRAVARSLTVAASRCSRGATAFRDGAPGIAEGSPSPCYASVGQHFRAFWTRSQDCEP